MSRCLWCGATVNTKNEWRVFCGTYHQALARELLKKLRGVITKTDDMAVIIAEFYRKGVGGSRVSS